MKYEFKNIITLSDYAEWVNAMKIKYDFLNSIKIYLCECATTV